LDLGNPPLLKEGRQEMSNVRIYRQRLKRMDTDRFAGIAKDLGIEGKPVETEEAIAVRAEGCTLAYAQPGGRFGGLLFYTDQSESQGQVAEKLADRSRALKWTRKFLDRHDLVPTHGEDGGEISMEFDATVPAAMSFDGRERREVSTVLNVAAAITLDGLPVTGPRGKLRAVFKRGSEPIAIHRGLWDKLEVFEEREVVSEDEAVKTALSRLEDRKCRLGLHRLHEVRCAYWAKEYEGGPDLLEPWYFVEVEFEDRDAKKRGISQGPRQVFRVAASR
jgi:hypothetical protein